MSDRGESAVAECDEKREDEAEGNSAAEEEEINVMAEADETSDVVLEVEGRELHASRAVLAHYSPVFRKMFFSDFKENGQKKVALPGKEFKKMVTFFNVLYPRTAASERLVTDANLIDLLTLADEYLVDQVKVECQNYIAGQLARYWYNFYNHHARNAQVFCQKGSLEGQGLGKAELIDKLLLYLWSCDAYGLPEPRDAVKRLLVAVVSVLGDVKRSRHYPHLPPLSKVELLEDICSKFN